MWWMLLVMISSDPEVYVASEVYSTRAECIAAALFEQGYCVPVEVEPKNSSDLKGHALPEMGSAL